MEEKMLLKIEKQKNAFEKIEKTEAYASNQQSVSQAEK
jgi:hypothetical protein